MKHFVTVLSHETKMLLVNPSTYIAAFFFLGVMGFFVVAILENYSATPQEISPATVFFKLFWVPVFFMVPLLTMKSFAEERRLGTLETLLTTPVTTTEVVLGKFSAAYIMYLLMWGSTAGFFYILSKFAGDERFMDYGPLMGGYLFIAVSGLLFISIGIFASSLSRNLPLAALGCFVLLFALTFGLQSIGGMEFVQLEIMRPARAVINYAQIFQHLDDFTRGVVDTRQLLFYVSGTVLTLLFSILGVEAKMLHG